MPRKSRRTKGQSCPPRKTPRIEVPIGVRQAMVNTDGKTSSTQEAANWQHRFSARTIRRIRQEAHERADQVGMRSGRNRPPLADISNVQNKGGRGGIVYFPPYWRKKVVEIVIASRESRELDASQHISNWNATYKKELKESLFYTIMYEVHLTHSLPSNKPDLTIVIREIRVVRARALKSVLETDPSSVIFIDAASVRLHEFERKRVWLTPDEYNHKDVIQPTNSNKNYSCGQFFGGICYAYRPGPCIVFSTETEQEKNQANKHINDLNQQKNAWDGLVFESAKAWEEREHQKRNTRKRGPPANREKYVINKEFKRGDRSKGGVDWYRFTFGYLKPHLIPWYKEIQSRHSTLQLVMDNAAAHSSSHTKFYLELDEIAQFLWPPQSPDLNPIEQMWHYIRTQIRKRRSQGTYPRNNTEMVEAWKEEWSKIPQNFIDTTILRIIEVCKLTIEHDGNNDFHG